MKNTRSSEDYFICSLNHLPILNILVLKPSLRHMTFLKEAKR